MVIVPVLVPAFVLVKSVLAAAVVVAVLANATGLVLVDGVVGFVFAMLLLALRAS